MSKKIDLTGLKINKLKVIKCIGVDKRNSQIWECICDCGETTIGITYEIKSGHKKSCGCYQKEQTSKAKSIDVSGQRFGKLTVIKRIGANKFSESFFSCLCDCGNNINVPLSRLKGGITKSCGCYKSEIRTKMNITHGNSFSSGITDEYRIYNAMLNRCYNKNQKCYKNYGGRGIFVCDRWLNSFQNFLDDMGKRPSKLYSIDRINNELGYSKDNCRWATQYEQQRNQRTNKWIEYNNKKFILNDFARLLNTSNSAISFHIKNGKSIEWIYNHFINKKNKIN